MLDLWGWDVQSLYLIFSYGIHVAKLHIHTQLQRVQSESCQVNLIASVQIFWSWVTEALSPGCIKYCLTQYKIYHSWLDFLSIHIQNPLYFWICMSKTRSLKCQLKVKTPSLCGQNKIHFLIKVYTCRKSLCNIYTNLNNIIKLSFLMKQKMMQDKPLQKIC